MGGCNSNSGVVGALNPIYGIANKSYNAGDSRSKQSTSSPPVWADPLGPNSVGPDGVAHYGASGAPQLRNQIFDYLKGKSPNATQYKMGEDLATRNVAGNYLNGSPQLDRAMAANRAGTMATAADATARLKSEFGKAGLSFSTANQQAAQSARTAAGADADRTSANAYLQNYMNERGIQNNAVQQFGAARSAPLDYLGKQGNIISGLSSGGQVITPNSTQTLDPSKLSSILNSYSSAMGSI